jgi:hypothetical protein
MPGETTIRVKELGHVLEGIEFAQFGEAGLAKPIMEIREKSGDHYTVMIVDGVGLAVGSHTTQRVFIMPAKVLLMLAQEAGVDDSSRTIIVPGEVVRG